jgi:hypothetical protein
MRIKAKLNISIPDVYNLRKLKSESGMNPCNLTGFNPMSKAAVRVFLLLTAVTLLVSCSEDSSTNVTGDIDFNGSYAAARVVERPDDVTEYVYGGSDLMGLMLIRDSSYTLDLLFRVGESVFGRSDSGSFTFSDGFLRFNAVIDTVLQSDPWGEYFPERSEIKINYLKNGHLWTETWKRATPVVVSDTSSNYIPY